MNKDNSSPRGARAKTEVVDVKGMLKTIPIACSWCNKIYHLKHWQIEEGRKSGISHGMCPDCVKKQEEELEKLDKLGKKV
ncbi:MAG: hypothetical protein JW808_00300 [Victivallales bacterium]|nr:hypothetical protein [Victivallales bacterium]